MYRYPNFSRFIQCFPQELNFNILIHFITHFYKHVNEKIVWQNGSYLVGRFSYVSFTVNQETVNKIALNKDYLNQCCFK